MSCESAPVDRLPRGPHGLTREEVIASQRGRLSYAAVEAVAAQGYQHVTVAEILSRAKVSRRSFYEMFDGKEDCFIAGVDYAREVVQNQLSTAIAGPEHLEWWELLQTTLESYLTTLAAHPALAYALHVETLAATTTLHEHRMQAQAAFATRMRDTCRLAIEVGDLAEQPIDEVFDILIGGIDDRVRSRLEAGEAASLPDLAPTLFRAALALFGRPEFVPESATPDRTGSATGSPP